MESPNIILDGLIRDISPVLNVVNIRNLKLNLEPESLATDVETVFQRVGFLSECRNAPSWRADVSRTRIIRAQQNCHKFTVTRVVSHCATLIDDVRGLLANFFEDVCLWRLGRGNDMRVKAEERTKSL